MTSRSPSNRHSGCEADSGREAASHSKVDSHRRKSSDRMAGRRFASRSARRCREDSRRADAHRRRQRNCRPASLSPSDHCSGGETDRRHAISREADGCLDGGEDGHLEPADLLVAKASPPRRLLSPRRQRKWRQLQQRSDACPQQQSRLCSLQLQLHNSVPLMATQLQPVGAFSKVRANHRRCRLRGGACQSDLDCRQKGQLSCCSDRADILLMR